MTTNNKPFAEIIESSLHGFLAQTWQWDMFPAFGSLVSIEQKDRILIGIVYQVRTGSMDPMRYPFTYQKTEKELLEEQPQIFEFLKTTFSCLIAGYSEKDRMHYQLAPHPAKIHAFVQPAPAILSKQFFASDQYLHTLVAQASLIGNIDELLLRLLAHQAEQKILSQDKLNPFLLTYSLLTGNDYRRIKLFLQRAQTVCL